MRKILFGVLIMMTTAFAVDYLVKVELDERRLEPFFEKGLMPIAELDNYALLLITDTDIDALTPHSYEIVATEPQRNEYYLVYVLSPTVDLSDFGRVLLIDGPVQLLELKPGMLEPLISENVDVSRVMFEPIVRSSPPAPLFYYNPLIQAIVDQVNPDTVLSFVQRLQDFKTRYSTHDSCHAAANYIAGKFTAYGCDSVYFQYHTTNHAPNVIGVKRGTVHPDSIYTVVCGHFDAISYMAPNVAPGADDNASGTTGVMEALRVMRDHQFEYSVRYIAFSGEEFGLYGSYYYASDARNRGDSILGVLNADMIGYVNAYPESLDVLAKISNPPCGAFADFFIAAADSYTTLLTNKQMVTSAAYSDHHPFWVNGYLALCNIEDNPPVNPFYHQPGDTIGAGYNDNTFCTEVIKAQVAALCLMAHPLAAAYLTTIDHWIIDSAPGGNGNGLWESGEEIDLIVRLQNLGIDTATNAYGLISSPSPYITIVEDSCYAGNIPAQDTAALAFRVSAAYAVPAPYEAHFDLYVACDTGAWDYSLMVYINPQPYLIFCDHAVVGGNGNGILEPGETADLVVTLANEGGAAAENVVSVLTTASSWVTVLDDGGAFGTIAAGDTANNAGDPYTVWADTATPTGTLAEFELIVTSAMSVDTFAFGLVVGKKHYYIWNPDPTPAPGQNMHTILGNLGYVGDYGTTLAPDLTLYQSVLVCVGVYANNYIINSASPEATALVNYLQNQGGRMYLEGGDVWYYDPPTGYNFGPLFGINAVADGTGDMGPVVGETGTFTQAMNFNYGGENSWMDHINPTSTGFLVFRDGNNNYNCGVANDAGTYRTVGTSFELGLLVDGAVPSTRAVLLDSIMHFFGIQTGGTGIVDYTQPAGVPLRTALAPLYPNPGWRVLSVRYQLAHTAPVELVLYDAAGRLVRTLAEGTQPPGYYAVTWDGVDDLGRKVPAGVYFVKFETTDYQKVQKAVLFR